MKQRRPVNGAAIVAGRREEARSRTEVAAMAEMFLRPHPSKREERGVIRWLRRRLTLERLGFAAALVVVLVLAWSATR